MSFKQYKWEIPREISEPTIVARVVVPALATNRLMSCLSVEMEEFLQCTPQYGSPKLRVTVQVI